MGVKIEEVSIFEVFAKICEENQKLMERIQKNIQKNKKLLDDALYLPMSGLLKQNSFMKYFENNCRISPRKLSISEDDTTLLIGN